MKKTYGILNVSREMRLVMKRTFFLIFCVIAFFFLIACEGDNSQFTSSDIITEADISTCDFSFSETSGQVIPIESIDIGHSKALTNTYNFTCPDETHPLILTDSPIKTHQIILSFAAIYPIESLIVVNYDGEEAQMIDELSIEVSIDGYAFNRVIDKQTLNQGENVLTFNGVMAKKMKLVYEDKSSPVGIQNVEAILGEGYIIKEETELSNQFLRTNGWTGADGVYTFDVNNGGDTIGLNHQTTGFIFSDTFIGTVNNEYRRIGFDFINNSFGYLNHTSNRMIFDWNDSADQAKSVLIPNAYIGSRARNLLDGDGLTITNQPTALLTNVNEGTMFLSDDLNTEILIDLKAIYDVSSIYLWNYNELPIYGVKSFDLYKSVDGAAYSKLGSFHMDQASGETNEPYTKELIYNQNTLRYLKLIITDTYSDAFVGLGKIQLYGSDGQKLFGDIVASSEISDLTINEESARLWLQDGIILNNKLYLFPILVKDFSTYFKVHNVGLVEMDIVNEIFDYSHARYINTPLMSTSADGGTIFFGAGLMDHRDKDGYIYIYGYKDLNGRGLVVSRVSEENFLNFNEWTYYNGETWVKDIDQVQTLKGGVSAELSVTYSDTGIFAGKYILVGMENTTSGKVVYSLSDKPFGPFSDYIQIYQTYENESMDAFTYNAKLHPNLSTPDKLIISYNVNSVSLAAFSDARIYYPRFISITQEKNKGE